MLGAQRGGAVGRADHRIGAGRQGHGRRAVAGQYKCGYLNRVDRRGRRRHRLFFGQLAVQWRRRNTLSRLRGAHHHPVAGRVLDQMRGVACRDHPQTAGRLRQRRCGLRLLHVALEGFFFLLQQFGALTGAAELIGTFRSVSGQPQRESESGTQRADHQHDERDLGREGARPKVDRSQLVEQPLSQRRPNDLGSLGLPSLSSSLGLGGALRAGRSLDRPGDRRGLWCRPWRARLTGRGGGLSGTGAVAARGRRVGNTQPRLTGGTGPGHRAVPRRGPVSLGAWLS